MAYHQAYSEVESAPAYELAPAELPVTPVDPALADASGNASPAAGFQPPAIAGSVGASVFDLNSQHLVYEHNAQQQFVPASSTKVLTATAALATMDLDKRLHTVIEQDGGRVVIRAGGDVWLDDADLDAAAAVIGQADSVEIDTSLWDGPTQAEVGIRRMLPKVILPRWNQPCCMEHALGRLPVTCRVQPPRRLTLPRRWRIGLGQPRWAFTTARRRCRRLP